MALKANDHLLYRGLKAVSSRMARMPISDKPYDAALIWWKRWCLDCLTNMKLTNESS